MTNMFLKVFGIAVCVIGLSATSVRADNLALCGGSPGGLFSLITAGLDAAVKESSGGHSITHQTSSGGYANILQVTKGKCELGLVLEGEARQAVKGAKPFKSPVSGFSVLMVTMDWIPMQWVMTTAFADKYGINSLADIAKNKPPLRLILNRRGILPSQMGELSLQAVGVELSDIESWGGKVEFQASRNASAIMQDRRADMWANSTLVGSSAIRKIANATPVKLLDIPDAARQAVIDQYGDKIMTIPAGAYPWLKRDVVSHSPKSFILVKDTMDEKVVFEVTKALLGNLKKVQGVHPAMKALSPEVMTSLKSFPYHPGAIRAYTEAGLM